MLTLLLAGFVVLVVAFALIAGVAARLCRRLGLDPLEVLWWFGLAEKPKIHSGRQRQRELERMAMRLSAGAGGAPS